ncbi:MAG: YciI family protein, partial [Pseudomonadota bacterium]|nr:YciI family protein [Pseudomonadota bacterium]
EYLNATETDIVLAGPVTADDRSTPIGSVMIISANSQEEAECFNQGDPFYRLNVWDKASIRIQPFVKRRGWSEKT